MEKIKDKDTIETNDEKIEYKIYETDIYYTPVALVITHFKNTKGGFVKSGKEYNSALYFDPEGKIIDRAPTNTYTCARKLQEKFSKPISENIRNKGKDSLLNSIKGFFEGEEGINREQFVKDKKFVRQDL